MTPLAEVFCDKLSVTSPLEELDAIAVQLRPLLDASGFSLEFEAERQSLYRAPTGGTVFIGTRPAWAVARVAASGTAIEQLRDVGLWGNYLAALAGRPHRVTELDATYQLPVDAAPIVLETAARAYAGGIQLSRKAIRRTDVHEELGFDIWGNKTGTVYVGPRNAEIRGKCYDKRWERWVRAEIDIGPMTRWEIRFRSQVGCTLRDAYAPEVLFWHHASRGLLEAPAVVHPWSPHSEGYTLPIKIVSTAAERMARKLDFSPDVDRLLELARECGPGGLDLLFARLTRKYEAQSQDLGASASALSVAKSGPTAALPPVITPGLSRH